MGAVRVSQSLHRIDVACFAGRPLEVTVSLEDGDGEPLAAAAVTSARAQVRTTPDSSSVLHTFSTDDVDTAEVADGSFTLRATGEETSSWGADWPGAGGWWDLEVTDADGETWQMLRPGRFTVARQVTR